MGAALAIRRDLISAEDLRRLQNRCTATRMLAITHALEGTSRADAARLVWLERQALRDAVLRFNAEGLAGLRDCEKPGRPPMLSEAEQAWFTGQGVPAAACCQAWNALTPERLPSLTYQPWVKNVTS